MADLKNDEISTNTNINLYIYIQAAKFVDEMDTGIQRGIRVMEEKRQTCMGFRVGR